MRPCDHCGTLLSTEGLPSSVRMWCSPACHEQWMQARPEELEGWVKIEDLSVTQHAHLLASLGLAEAKA